MSVKLNQLRQKTMIAIWYRWYPILFSLSYSQAPLFTQNQNTKFIKGLSDAGYGDLAADWMSQVTDPFPLFSFLLKYQYLLMGLHVGVHLGFYFVTAVYGQTALTLVRQSEKDRSGKANSIFLFSLIWLVIHFEPIREILESWIPFGLGGQYMLGYYYQPCIFGVFILTGILAFQEGRLVRAGVFILLAPLMHPTYVITSILVTILLVVLSANQSNLIRLRFRLLFGILLVFAACIFSYFMCKLLLTEDPAIVTRAHTLLATVRIKHHALPTEWDIGPTLMFFGITLVAAIARRNTLPGQLLLAMLLFIGITVVLSMWRFNSTLAVLAPWRVSVVMFPLALMILVGSIARWIAGFGGLVPLLQSKVFVTGAIVGGVILSFIGGFDLFYEYQGKAALTKYATAAFVKSHHHANSLYLVPPNEMSFRLEAGVPVYATWKSHPTKDDEFLEWYDRIQKVKAFYKGEMTSEEAAAFIQRSNITHVVWPKNKSNKPALNSGNVEYNDDYYELWNVILDRPSPAEMY